MEVRWNSTRTMLQSVDDAWDGVTIFSLIILALQSSTSNGFAQTAFALQNS
jgi:hypothetical protein